MVESEQSLNKSERVMSADLGKLFTEWSDDEDADPERSTLLREYDRMQTKSKRARPDYPNGQPQFHQNNRNFTEAFLPCCVGDGQNCQLTELEVSDIR